MTDLLCRGMNRREVDSFAYGVLADMELDKWDVEWSKASPGLCIHDDDPEWPSRDSGTILLPIKYLAGQPLWFALEYVLHEVAHIDTFTGYGDGHTPKFFSEYARLVDKYLGRKNE